MWKVLDKTCESEAKLVSREPQYVLDCAWRACGKAEVWQRVALEHSAAGRAANDRLDAAMRLFNYASGGESSGEFAVHTIEAFIEQVRLLTIEADSLAHTAPIDQAVTLTTPAGAAGKRWNLVFLPALQQGQWPNLTPRNTLFGGEELADVMLHGVLSDTIVTPAGRPDAQLASVLASEQKSLLVALTRASERVVVSAVLNDDNVPSDFLYGYMPECFDRDRDAIWNGENMRRSAAKAITRGWKPIPVVWSRPPEACSRRNLRTARRRVMPRKRWHCWLRMVLRRPTLTVGRLWGRRSRPPCGRSRPSCGRA